MGVRQGGAPPYVTPAFLSFRTHTGRHTRTHTYAHALHHAPSYLRHAVKGVTPPPHPSPPGPCPPMLCGARCVIRPHVNCQYGFPKSGKWLTCHPPRGRVGQDRRGCRRAIHGRPRVFLRLQVRRPCQWSSLRFGDLQGRARGRQTGTRLGPGVTQASWRRRQGLGPGRGEAGPACARRPRTASRTSGRPSPFGGAAASLLCL